MTINSDIKFTRKDELEINTASFILFDSNILKVRFKDVPTEFSIDDAMAHTAVIKSMTGDRPCHIILDFRNADISFSNQARDYFAQNPSHSLIRLSQAIIVTSLAHKIVANFYMQFNRPNCPAMIFEKENDAFKWTMGLIK